MGCEATPNGGPAARIAAFVPRQRLQGVYAKKTVGADELGEAAMGCAATPNGGPAPRIACPQSVFCHHAGGFIFLASSASKPARIMTGSFMLRLEWWTRPISR